MRLVRYTYPDQRSFAPASPWAGFDRFFSANYADSAFTAEVEEDNDSLVVRADLPGVAKENLSASESVIADTDVASEMTNFTRYQILQQTGMAMLSQANQRPAYVLALLR